MELSLKSKWLGSRVFTGTCDVLTINSCHVETVVLMSRGAVRPVDERFARTGAEA